MIEVLLTIQAYEQIKKSQKAIPENISNLILFKKMSAIQEIITHHESEIDLSEPVSKKSKLMPTEVQNIHHTI